MDMQLRKENNLHEGARRIRELFSSCRTAATDDNLSSKESRQSNLKRVFCSNQGCVVLAAAEPSLYYCCTIARTTTFLTWRNDYLTVGSEGFKATKEQIKKRLIARMLVS